MHQLPRSQYSQAIIDQVVKAKDISSGSEITWNVPSPI